MRYRKEINYVIEDLEKSIAIHKAVQERFPDSKVQFVKNNNFNGFLSKSINNIYSNFEFVETPTSVSVAPYLKFEIDYNGNKEEVKIHSIPRYSKLVYTHYDLSSRKRIVSFSRLNFNIKNNNFKDDMLSECRIKILDFIKKNHNLRLDKKHLDPKLAKLLSFI